MNILFITYLFVGFKRYREYPYSGTVCIQLLSPIYKYIYRGK